MSQAISAYSVEERIVGEATIWVAIRARGAEWSWLTPAEAAYLGKQWVAKYGPLGKPSREAACQQCEGLGDDANRKFDISRPEWSGTKCSGGHEHEPENSG